MVAEQIGPQGKEGQRTNTTEGAETESTKHKTQSVWHGPVVYVDSVYDTVIEISHNSTRIPAFIFTKSKKYAAQREYRFAVMHQGADEEIVDLQISGMMKDSLNLTQYGLVRKAPVPLNAGRTGKSQPCQKPEKPPTPKQELTTTRNQSTKREERRWETRDPDGQVLSSDSEIREAVQERTVTQRRDMDQDDCQSRTGNGNDETKPKLITAEIPETKGIWRQGIMTKKL